MASSKLVNSSRPSSVYLEDDEDYKRVPENNKAETRVLLYEFFVERAEHDESITHEERQSIHESTVECIRQEDSTPGEVGAWNIVITLYTYFDLDHKSY